MPRIGIVEPAAGRRDHAHGCRARASWSIRWRSPPARRQRPNERESRWPPSVPGYEIMSELGRGGMGVVYKARHVRLNRPCALKMILAGAHASPEDVARFMTEAEAIARLQHPNIVQIRQIGEADGLPFLELEYVGAAAWTSSSTARPGPRCGRRGLPSRSPWGSPRPIGRGSSIATSSPRTCLLAADGTPKVGDFGLAKMLDSKTGLTRTESVMGSPSYMAPEQAQGRAEGRRRGRRYLRDGSDPLRVADRSPAVSRHDRARDPRASQGGRAGTPLAAGAGSAARCRNDLPQVPSERAGQAL